MPARLLKCLATITRANVANPCILPCIEDGATFLVIPMEDYAIPEAEGRKEMTLRIPDHWLVAVSGGGYDLLCRKIINLDKFAELPWTELPPSRV